ncbi:MAG: hypothetical protein KKC80_05900 [Candidatus Margulisbacteria bacterium]|nr:hypothetical protein [Candidatus Margulisiibacteriota bacterium]MBU1616397.1 hypothetical protein [Candidatus Margulisiibacteriota bacterium]
MINNARKKVISEIFRDVTKLTVIALVVGQFVPGNPFNLAIFIFGLLVSALMGFVAALFAVSDKEEA